MAGDFAALLDLLRATSLERAEHAVARLVSSGYGWAPLGGKEGNFGLVNIGSDPALAFVERVTNAIDAVLDYRAAQADPKLVAALESPRDAARELFGIPEGTESNLDAEAAAMLAQMVAVTVRDGAARERPTLEVRDQGAGIAPDAMPNTILNLAGSNKIGKRYLAGAFGQGGSTTFAFSPHGCTIASATDDSDVGVTFVRYHDLDPRRNKNGRYEYLAGPRGALGSLARERAEFQRGTLVRHFDYDLPAGVRHASEPEGLAALLAGALFDPILPFGVNEARHFDGLMHVGPSSVVRGRLADLAAAGAAVEHAQAVACVVAHRRSRSFATARYWVLEADDSPLHPDRKHPVALTYYGQTHGFEDRRFIVDELRLPFLKSALVVQVELDALAPSSRRELFSTTRDRLKRGAVYRTLLESVRDALLEDGALDALNAQRRQRLLERQAATDQKRLRRRFAELMDKFHPGPDPLAATRRNGTGVAAPDGGSAPDGTPVEPLPTRAHPTFVRIAAKKRPLQVPLGRTARVAVESDAPDGYVSRHAQARIVAVGEPDGAMEFVRATDFRGGRASVTVRGTGRLDAHGALRIRLTIADGTVLDDEAPFILVAPPPPSPADRDGAKGVRLPDVFEVHRARWPEFGFDEMSVASVNASKDAVSIFVNMDNQHLQRLIASVQYQETGLARMRTSFLVQGAFYAYLQHEARAAFTAIDDALLETYERLELDRVARTIVTAIGSVERIDGAALSDESSHS